jgi:hypothetical protein
MQRKFEQSAKTSDAADTALAVRRFDGRLDAFYQFVSGVDIDA